MYLRVSCVRIFISDLFGVVRHPLPPIRVVSVREHEYKACKPILQNHDSTWTTQLASLNLFDKVVGAISGDSIQLCLCFIFFASTTGV